MRALPITSWPRQKQIGWRDISSQVGGILDDKADTFLNGLWDGRFKNSTVGSIFFETLAKIGQNYHGECAPTYLWIYIYIFIIYTYLILQQVAANIRWHHAFCWSTILLSGATRDPWDWSAMWMKIIENLELNSECTLNKSRAHSGLAARMTSHCVAIGMCFVSSLLP